MSIHEAQKVRTRTQKAEEEQGDIEIEDLDSPVRVLDLG
jgi:hypothetical protein